MRSWSRELAGELSATAPDVVLFHYSAFSYGYRGVPLLVRPALSVLRSSQLPVTTVLHEYAYPWRARDWRGNLWALTQRAALVDVMRVSGAAIATTDFRVTWLHSRSWLPKRPLAMAPVFSNLPPPAQPAVVEHAEQLVGLFGYAHESAAISLVTGAIADLRRRRLDVRLELLGAPGAESAAGEAWRAAAAAAGVAEALSFSGVLSAQELSDDLSACDVLLFTDPPGPTSRKGTLAGSLASGTPVIAVDGPSTWQQLAKARSVHLVAPGQPALVEGLALLLGDPSLRKSLGARGRAFAKRHMSVDHSAEVVAALIGDLLA